MNKPKVNRLLNKIEGIPNPSELLSPKSAAMQALGMKEQVKATPEAVKVVYVNNVIRVDFKTRKRIS